MEKRNKQIKDELRVERIRRDNFIKLVARLEGHSTPQDALEGEAASGIPSLSHLSLSSLAHANDAAVTTRWFGRSNKSPSFPADFLQGGGLTMPSDSCKFNAKQSLLHWESES